MRAIRGYVAAVVAALLAFGFVTSYASAKGTNSTDVIIQLRVAGDVEALPPVRSCLADKLSQMPDVKVATASTDGARFVVDIVAAKNTNQKLGRSDRECYPDNTRAKGEFLSPHDPPTKRARAFRDLSVARQTD